MAKSTSTLAQRRGAPPREGSATAGRARRPRLLARFGLAHGLMALAALSVFVLVASLTADRSRRVAVAVAATDVAAGAVLTPAVVRPAELPAGSDLAGTVATVEGLRTGTWVATRPIPAGDPVARSAVVPGPARNRLRSMSVPVPEENAVGGALVVGDTVDVVDVADDRAHFVVTGAQVTKVPQAASPGGLTGGGPRRFYVVVDVDEAGALALARALADGKVDVVRSTGAHPAAPLPAPVEEESGGDRP